MFDAHFREFFCQIQHDQSVSSASYARAQGDFVKSWLSAKHHLSFFCSQDLVPDLSLFFQQLSSIDPFLKPDKKLERAAGDKELYQSIEDREKVCCFVCCVFFFCFMCVCSLMGAIVAFFAHAAALRVRRIGGTRKRIIWVLQCCNK